MRKLRDFPLLIIFGLSLHANTVSQNFHVIIVIFETGIPEGFPMRQFSLRLDAPTKTVNFLLFLLYNPFLKI